MAFCVFFQVQFTVCTGWYVLVQLCAMHFGDRTCWNYALQMKQLFLLHDILSQHTTDHHLVSLYGKT